MSWLSDQEREMLEATIIHSPACMLFSKPDGTILWANNAFIKWIGYTLYELQKMTWMELTVPDANLTADIAEAKEMAKNDGYSVFYGVMKQYVRKHGEPSWGMLHVMRYPPIGQLACCICVWEPLKESFTESFNLIRETANKGNAAMSSMREALEQLTANIAKPEENTLMEKAMLILMKIVSKYPRRSLAILTFFFILLGGNLAVDTIIKYQKIMTLQQPSKQEP